MDFKICPAVFTKMPCRKIDTSFRTHICPWMVTSSRLSANNISKNNCTSLRQFCTFLGLTELAGRCFVLWWQIPLLPLPHLGLGGRVAPFLWRLYRSCQWGGNLWPVQIRKVFSHSTSSSFQNSSHIITVAGMSSLCFLPGRQPVLIHVTIVNLTTFVWVKGNVLQGPINLLNSQIACVGEPERKKYNKNNF